MVDDAVVYLNLIIFINNCFNNVNTEGNNAPKLSVGCLCMYVIFGFIFAPGLILWICRWVSII